MRPRVALLVLLVAPLLVAASDARDDVAACRGDEPAPASAPDLLEVTGEATELGTVATWRLRFDRPIEVPSDLRIDILVLDPELPAGRVGDLMGLNRLVSWRADAPTTPVEIAWLPLGDASTFNPPRIDGAVVEIVMPGRLLLGEEEDGTQNVSRARWGVVVRYGAACDRLGSGAPTERFAGAVQTSPVTSPSADAEDRSGDRPAVWPWVLSSIVAVLVAVIAVWFRRR